MTEPAQPERPAEPPGGRDAAPRFDLRLRTLIDGGFSDGSMIAGHEFCPTARRARSVSWTCWPPQPFFAAIGVTARLSPIVSTPSSSGSDT